MHFTFQTPDRGPTHEAVLNGLLSEPATIRAALISVAYVRDSGVRLLQHALALLGDRVEALVGIRNGVTSAQGVLRLLKVGVRVQVVDTASASLVFHPKVVLVKFENGDIAGLLGSMNLTRGGLVANFEASVRTRCCEGEAQHSGMMALWESLASLPISYPRNVFQLARPRDVVELLRQGRLTDEREHKPAAHGLGRADNSVVASVRIPPIRARRSRGSSHSAPHGRRPPLASCPHRSRYAFYEVWRSGELTRRDLCIPESAGTHPTGSMLLKRGAYPDIDFQRYFRDEVFVNCDWQRAEDGEREMTTITASLVVRAVFCGKFALRVKHDPRTDTATYLQRNAVTQLHWGEAKPLVARPELLGGTLILSRSDSLEPEFQIEIE